MIYELLIFAFGCALFTISWPFILSRKRLQDAEKELIDLQRRKTKARRDLQAEMRKAIREARLQSSPLLDDVDLVSEIVRRNFIDPFPSVENEKGKPGYDTGTFTLIEWYKLAIEFYEDWRRKFYAEGIDEDQLGRLVNRDCLSKREDENIRQIETEARTLEALLTDRFDTF